MNREEAMSFIENSKKFGSKLELVRIKKLCELLGNPQDSLKCTHIAGTNGKGSTSVFVNNILIDAGYKVGLYTSPYIYEFNERIQINNKSINDKELTEIMSLISDKVEIMKSEGYEHPTEFELITAAAFLYFKNKKCDYVVLEVGLGGSYDATNVIKNPVLSIITSISLDHTDYLGNTVAEVAKNKCGIIKENCPTVTYMSQTAEALNVIKKTAQEKNSELTVCDSSLKIIKCDLSGNEFLYNKELYKTKLIGKYQIYNAVTAINAALKLRENGLVLTDKNIKNGLNNAKWPARFEILETSPTVIADGSHNGDGMMAFVETAKQVLNDKKTICVFGMLRDKDYDFCLKELSKITDTVIVTEVDNPRRETIENLGNTAKKYIKNVYLEKENGKALKKAIEIAKKDDVIIALGSLYMMKNIKKCCE